MSFLPNGLSGQTRRHTRTLPRSPIQAGR